MFEFLPSWSFFWPATPQPAPDSQKQRPDAQSTQSSSVPKASAQSASSDGSGTGRTPVTAPPVAPPRTSGTAPILFYDKDEPYYEFTNFSQHDVIYEGKRYPTSEHLFQAFKFMDDHPKIAERIRKCGERSMLAFDEAHRYQKFVRPDWKQVHVEMMDIVLYRKFTRHADIKALLLGTGDAELVEDSPRDYFWGIGADHSGRNELGKALMRLRTKLRQEEDAPYKVPAAQKDTTHLAARDLRTRPGSNVNAPHSEERNNQLGVSTSPKRAASLPVLDHPPHVSIEPIPNVNAPRSEERGGLLSFFGFGKRDNSPSISPNSAPVQTHPVSRPSEAPATHKETPRPSAQDSSPPAPTQPLPNAKKPRFSAAPNSGSRPTRSETAPPQGDGLCEFCHARPKFENHPYCGRKCAAEAASMCSYCHLKPRYGKHPYCSKTCAARAAAAADQPPKKEKSGVGRRDQAGRL